ncbi:MAG: hypothetical protein BGO14_07445 [Chlamydiales bacterium 38-26]|nr:hypothetical protein [Chlamydiales bacterium]OJV10837.1 MAG: hypothetical protein BGO14_07445 [Chlamydiales bacterium 38-26]
MSFGFSGVNRPGFNDFKPFYLTSRQIQSVEFPCQTVHLIASLVLAFSPFRQAKEIVLLRCNLGEIDPNLAKNSEATQFVITGGHKLTHIDFMYKAKNKPTSLVITGAHSILHLSPSPDCKNCSEEHLSDLHELVLTGAHSLEDIPIQKLKNLKELVITGGDHFQMLDQIKAVQRQFNYINISYASHFKDYVFHRDAGSNESKS